MSSKYNILDLFAGCGGLKDGFLQTGEYHTVGSVEWEEKPVKTLRNRLKKKYNYDNADEMVLHFDIQREEELFRGWENDSKYGSSKGLDYLVNKARGIDLIIGGPPCQAYSIAGRVRDKHGMRNDYRNYLFEHYLNVVDRYRPKIFIFENVPGILSAKPGNEYVLDMITKSFKDHGYILSENLDKIGIVNAADYGVPQNRNRLFILGVRKDLLKDRDETIIDQFYSVILPKYKSKKVTTVEMAIGDLTPVVPIWDERHRGERKSYNFEESINWHKPRYHNLRDMRIYELLAKDIESGENKYIGAKAITKLYEEKIGSKSPIHRYHVLRKNLPSTTIIAHLYKDGNRFIHYDSKQARTITPRETARLQSFDDDFEFIGTQGHVYKMIGNAVPPKLAFAIGRATSDFLDELLKK